MLDGRVQRGLDELQPDTVADHGGAAPLGQRLVGPPELPLLTDRGLVARTVLDSGRVDRRGVELRRLVAKRVLTVLVGEAQRQRDRCLLVPVLVLGAEAEQAVDAWARQRRHGVLCTSFARQRDPPVVPVTIAEVERHATLDDVVLRRLDRAVDVRAQVVLGLPLGTRLGGDALDRADRLAKSRVVGLLGSCGRLPRRARQLVPRSRGRLHDGREHRQPVGRAVAALRVDAVLELAVAPAQRHRRVAVPGDRARPGRQRLVVRARVGAQRLVLVAARGLALVVVQLQRRVLHGHLGQLVMQALDAHAQRRHAPVQAVAVLQREGVLGVKLREPLLPPVDAALVLLDGRAERRELVDGGGGDLRRRRRLWHRCGRSERRGAALGDHDRSRPVVVVQPALRHGRLPYDLPETPAGRGYWRGASRAAGRDAPASAAIARTKRLVGQATRRQTGVR